MVDVVQARYGWTDEYIFETLPAERVRMVFDVVSSQRNEEQKDKLRLEAFSVWLTSGQEGVSFDEFVSKLNLPFVDPDEAEQDANITADDAWDIAHNILRRFRPNESEVE